MSDDKLSRIAAAVIGVLSRLLIVEYVVFFAIWYWQADGLRDPSGTPLGADFLNVYAAGIMARQGHAPAIYDWVSQRQVEQQIAGYASPYFAWHYPPLFIGVAALIACLPYLAALAFYMLAGLAAYLYMIRRLGPPSATYFWAMAAFPGVFCNLINGQNGFITASLFGTGINLLEKQPWLAGICFGLLAYKPQFFIVIPLMLAVGRHGRACLSTCVTALASMGLSWLVFGTDTWLAFFKSTVLTQHIILEQGVTGWQKIQSVFACARMWGGSVQTAYLVQSIVALAALASAGWLWQRRDTSPAVRTSALAAAMLLTTPYLLDYDLVILAIPISLLMREALQNDFRRHEKILIGCLWVLPMLARELGKSKMPLTPFALAALLSFCMYAAQKDAKKDLPAA